MARLSQLALAALLALAVASAHAGYAQLAPPPGFAPMPTASPERYGYAKAANEAWVNGTVRNTAALNVGGQSVKVPVGLRFAANAPRFAAAALFMHPGLRFAAGALAWLSTAKFIWDEASQSWRKLDDLGASSGGSPDGFLYIASVLNNRAGWDSWHKSKDAACSAYVDFKNSDRGTSSTYNLFTLEGVSGMNCIVKRQYYLIGKPYGSPTNDPYSGLISKPDDTPQDCPVNTTKTDAGCLSPAISQPDFIDDITKPTNPMPESVPNELPDGTPLPVRPPIINPTPGDNPQSQPYFIPTGNPVPNPSYDPNAAPSPQNQPWFQPGVRIVPAPTADEPWRVDVQPVNRPTTSPDPKTVEELNPPPDPVANPDPANDPAKDDKAKPEEQQSLCEKHPDIVACQKLGTVSAEPVKNTDKTLLIQKDEGWGPANGTCPAPRTISMVTVGRQLEFSFQPLCDFANGVRPIVIALAWLSATLGFVGLGRKS